MEGMDLCAGQLGGAVLMRIGLTLGTHVCYKFKDTTEGHSQHCAHSHIHS